MKYGDLVKIMLRTGAVSYETGMYIGKSPGASLFSPLIDLFLINGQIEERSSTIYNFRAINESN